MSKTVIKFIFKDEISKQNKNEFVKFRLHFEMLSFVRIRFC